MQVAVYRADDGGCGRSRLLFPLQVLQGNGYAVEDRYQETIRAIWQPSPFGDQVVGIDGDIGADVVVFQRPLTRTQCELIGVLQDRDVAVVVEIDDDFGKLPLRHPARAELDPAIHRDKNWQWLERCCQKADLVTVSTPALAQRYGAHGRVMVLPNYVPERYLSVERTPHDPLWVGWTGSVHTHVGDLDVTKGMVGVAMAEYGAELHVIGTGQDVGPKLGSPVVGATGWVDIDDYPKAYAALDVAVAPLKLNAFNAGKSWLKIEEAAALGVPWIASPTPEYQSLHEMGCGLLAETPEDWYRQTKRLLADPILRTDLSAAGREVMAELTYEKHAHEWADAWSQAFLNRQANLAA